MKNSFKFLTIATAVMAFATNSFAQGASATATATATIVTPIAITQVTNMNFGNVASSSTAGTIILTPAGTETSTLGATIPNVRGTVTAATFTVTGTTPYTYIITLPADGLVLTNGANNMTLTVFTSTPSATGVLTGGTQTLAVGATLNVGASQVVGTYVSLPFTVTVNYN